MFNDVPEKERERKLIDGGLDITRLLNITLVNREGNAVIRRHLESLPLESFDSVSSTLFFILPPMNFHRILLNGSVHGRMTDEKPWIFNSDESDNLSVYVIISKVNHMIMYVLVCTDFNFG